MITNNLTNSLTNNLTNNITIAQLPNTFIAIYGT